jgi:hypothetical protein
MSTTTSFNQLSPIGEMPGNGSLKMWKAAGALCLVLAVFGVMRSQQDAATDGQVSTEFTTSSVSGNTFTPDDRFAGYVEVMNTIARNSSAVCQNTSNTMAGTISQMRLVADTSHFGSFLALHESLESVKAKAQESGCL